jgi:hypothetical protein
MFPLKPRFFEFIQNPKGNLSIWENPLWELDPCVEVTLVSKFHPFWCLIAQESKLGRKDLVFCTRTVNNFVSTGQVRSGRFTGLVRSGIFSPTFNYYFEHNLLTVSPIDPILLPLAL